MRWLNLVLLLPVFGACSTGGNEGRRPPASSTILFLCPYGGAKSVIAASYFNRLAQECALPYVAVAASAEDPYAAVPAPVADFLERDGMDVRSFKPRHFEPSDVQGAARVVSIDCDLAAANLTGTAVERWDDVPKVSEDLPASADAIRRHVEALAEELRGHR
jgi:arsenate reductase